LYKQSTYKWIPKGRTPLSWGFPWTRDLLASITKKSRIAAKTGRIPIGSTKIPVTRPVGRIAKGIIGKATRETDVGALYLSTLPLGVATPGIPLVPETITSVYAYGIKPIAKKLAKGFKSFA